MPKAPAVMALDMAKISSPPAATTRPRIPTTHTATATAKGLRGHPAHRGSGASRGECFAEPIEDWHPGVATKLRIQGLCQTSLFLASIDLRNVDDAL